MRVGSDEKNGNWCESKKKRKKIFIISETDLIYSITVDHIKYHRTNMRLFKSVLIMYKWQECCVKHI